MRVLYLSITIFAFGSCAIYPPSKDFLDVVNALSPKPFAPVNIVDDLPLPLANPIVDVAAVDVACDTSAFVGAAYTGAGAGAGGYGAIILLATPPILSS